MSKASPQRRIFSTPKPLVGRQIKFDVKNLSTVNIDKLPTDHLRVSDILYYLSANEFYTVNIKLIESKEKTMILFDIENLPEHFDYVMCHSMNLPYNAFFNMHGNHFGMLLDTASGEVITGSCPTNCTLGFMVYGTSHAKTFLHATQDPHRCSHAITMDYIGGSFSFPAYIQRPQDIIKLADTGSMLYILDAYGIIRETYDLNGIRHGKYLYFSNQYTITSNFITTALFQLFRLGNDLTMSPLVGPRKTPELENLDLNYDSDNTLPEENIMDL